MNSNWLFNKSSVFHADSFIDFIYSALNSDQLSNLILIYCIANALISIFIWFLLPNKYRFPVLTSYAFIYCIVFFIPVFGAIGLVFLILPSLYFQKKIKADILDIQQPINLPYTQLEKQDSLLFNDGGLHDVLSLQVNDDKRLNVLFAMRNMNKQDAIPILKKALRDPADDIRLLAYAMLDKYETQVNVNLEAVLSQLNATQGAHKAELHKQVAINYWELAYLGLAQGAVLEHALEQAQDNIQQAILFKETPELALLQGRVALKQKRSGFAILAFQRSIVLGMDKQHVLPYLAEAAYLSGQYQDISGLLAQLPEALRNRHPFFELAGYWHVNANPF